MYDYEANKPGHEVDELGMPTDPVLRELEGELCSLAGKLRNVGSVEEAERLTQEYEAVLERMYALGWDGLLDYDCEVYPPPEIYMKRTARFGKLNTQED